MIPFIKLDPAKTRLVKELKHTSPLLSCRFDPSGRFVLASAQDRTIQRWDILSGTATAFSGHQSWVRSLTFQPNGKVLYSAGYDGRLLAWPVEAESPEPMWNSDAHHGWIRSITVSPDGRVLASCGNDSLVKLWSAADGRCAGELVGHSCHVYNVAFHPDGRHLVSADLKGGLRQWELSTGKTVRELDARVLHKYDETFRADIGGVRSMAFNADGSLLACSGITEVTNAFAGVGKPIIVLFDWQSGKPKPSLVPKENFQGTAWGVAFHREGWISAVGGGNGGALWFWKADQSPAQATIKLPSNARDLAVHPNGTRLAVPFFDCALRIYDVGIRVELPTSLVDGSAGVEPRIHA